MKPDAGRVLSVNITSVVHEGGWTGDKGRTGIDKRPFAGSVRAANNCFSGDVIADFENHGGYDAAVYAYAREDADWWQEELGISIANGKFGENLTAAGIDVNGAVVGEQWSIGTTVLEVSSPRIPCRVFAGFWDRPTLIKDFTKAGRPGTYLRILKEGDLSGGDAIVVSHRPLHGITISDLFAAKNGERSKIAEIVRVPELSERNRDWAKRILETMN